MILLWPLVNQGQTVKALTIGDRARDITITHVYNYPDSTIHLSDLKGKLVILDFWATWCGSCIATFPEMEKLQKEFEGQLQIIMVNSYYPDNNEKVQSFFNKREQRTGQPFTLTYALQDTLLRQLFPYKQIPHDVWINGEGKVVAITSASEVNEENIRQFIKDGTINLPLKDDNLLFNPEKPLLIGENSSHDPSFIYRSIITGYKKHLGSTIGQRTNGDGKITRVYVINAPLITLLEKAYPNVFSVPLNRMVIETDMPVKNAILNPDATPYCYELITGPSTAGEIQTFEQQDLFRTFHLSARNEIREVNCYALKILKREKIRQGNSRSPQMDAEPETRHKIFINQPVSILISFLERLIRKTVVNETGFNGTIDLEIPRDIYDFSVPRLMQFLKSNGFELVPAHRKMKAIVVVQQ
jgi:thiol-disulfide isomerase/thioredoxin